MKRDIRREWYIGMIFFVTFLVLRQIPPVPEFFLGAFAALGITFQIVGIIPEERYKRLKSFKARLVKRQ